MNEIVNAVTTLGFPIVMCGALFWYMVKQNEIHKSETDEIKDVVSQLKEAIIKLTERLTKGDE